MHTPRDQTDAFLMPGFTYSDYESDVHITTISRGGHFPMEYLNVAVNVGTVESGDASAPESSWMQIRVLRKWENMWK